MEGREENYLDATRLQKGKNEEMKMIVKGT
jgi:hypothetical protein